MAVQKLCRVELSASAAQMYASTNQLTQITAASASNKTASAVEVSVYIVDDGGSTSDANALIVESLSIPGNSAVGIPELVGQALAKNESIHASASSANAITLFMSGNVPAGS